MKLKVAHFSQLIKVMRTCFS